MSNTTNTFAFNHIPEFDQTIIADQLQVLNDELASAGMYFMLDVQDDLGFTSYAEIPDNCLVVMVSFDFTYYHQMEFGFHGVLAHSITHDGAWPDHWNKPQIELLHGAERSAALAALQLASHTDCLIFAFNIGSFSDERYYIAAKGISIAKGIVFYYNRAAQTPLEPGERMAWWVTK